MIKIVDTEEEVLKLEQLRSKCMRSPRIIDNPRKTIYGEKILNKEFIGLSLEEDNKLIGGCIVSTHFNHLYIEWLFTDFEYRKKGNASKLLNYIESNIEFFKKYYSIDSNKILLEPYIAVEDFYKKNGYKNLDDTYMVKIIKKQ